MTSIYHHHHHQSIIFIIIKRISSNSTSQSFKSKSKSKSTSTSKYHLLNLIISTTLLLLTLNLNVNAQSQPLPCQRWAQQTTISTTTSSDFNFNNLNATLWIQGGQIKSSPDQTTHTWTNALLSLDLTKPWNAGSPALNLIIKDNSNPYSPPAVSLGSLWASNDGQSLYQWGGQFADNPSILPGPTNTYKFDLSLMTWNSINTNGESVLRASEGASALVPNLGSGSNHLAYYFGGHLDWASVPNWSNSTPRVFLDSIIELDLGSLSWKNYSSVSD